MVVVLVKAVTVILQMIVIQTPMELQLLLMGSVLLFFNDVLNLPSLVRVITLAPKSSQFYWP